MVVIIWDPEQVRVYQQTHVVSIEGGEHLAHIWDSDLTLVKHSLFFSEEDTVGDGSVAVCVWVVIQANHVAPSEKVEEDRSEKGEHANDSTESGLQGEALDS